MTSCYTGPVLCGNCGTEVEISVVQSTNAFGSCDLDMRPAEMARSTIDTWVHCCQHCGFCAWDLTRAWPSDRARVKEADYQRQLTHPDFPPLANRFLCQNLLHLARADYSKAFDAALHAAWACDDAGHRDQAITCRLLACDCLEAADSRHDLDLDQPGSNVLVLTDLLRRAGQTDRARDALANAADPIDPFIQHLLDFEAILLDKNDQDAHTVEDALTFLQIPFPD